jgi:hypothetical protein
MGRRDVIWSKKQLNLNKFYLIIYLLSNTTTSKNFNGLFPHGRDAWFPDAEELGCFTS